MQIKRQGRCWRRRSEITRKINLRRCTDWRSGVSARIENSP
jgi:hypothetical protein